jgi:Flp pilus assembly protein TadG
MPYAARDERGAAAVEFGLLLFPLILILLGIVEFGRGYNAKITLTHAAREGARAAAVGKPFSEVQTTVTAAATSLTGVTVDPIGTCTPGAPVTVTVRYPFTYDTPLFGGTVSLTSKGTMRCGG